MTEPENASGSQSIRADTRAGQPRTPNWRVEALRTTFWVVPTLFIVVAAVLFAVTFEVDLAAYHHHLSLPWWVRTGSADAGRQVLIAIAAAVITTVGVVFSITILALTLASQQFGPRMMRNFVRDIGNQMTLGVFVGTFVYSVLALGSITSLPGGDFVPHLSITVAEGLLLVDVAVLVYFIHHIAKSIQLPEVIAGIARDLDRAIDAEFPEHYQADDAEKGRSSEIAVDLTEKLRTRGAVVTARQSGYLQFVGYGQLIEIAESLDAVIRLAHRPGSLRGRPSHAGHGLAGRRRRSGRLCAGQGSRDRSPSDPHPGPGVRHRSAGRDRHPGAVGCGQRHLHRAHLHRLVVGRVVGDLVPSAGRRVSTGAGAERFG